MREWFKERTGLDSEQLIHHMNKVDEMLLVSIDSEIQMLSLLHEKADYLLTIKQDRSVLEELYSILDDRLWELKKLQKTLLGG